MRAINAFVLVVFCVFVPNTEAKSFAELAECLHGVRLSCGHCRSNIPEDKRDAVVNCLKAEGENRRNFMRTCFEEKGGLVNSQCYKFDSAHLPKIYMGSHSKLGAALTDASKPAFDCWIQCLQEKIGEFDACQEGCGEGDPETKEKINQCIGEGKARYPLPETKSCLTTAYGVQLQQRLRRFKIHQELEIDAEK